jgi:ribosomal protein L7/L12
MKTLEASIMANSEQGHQAFTQEIIEAISSQKKLQAIKLLRNKTGLGLKEAKDAIETYIEDNAEINEIFHAKKASSLSQENIVHIIILLIVLLIVYIVI